MNDYIKLGFWRGIFIGWILASIIVGSCSLACGVCIGYGYHAKEILPNFIKLNDVIMEMYRNR